MKEHLDRQKLKQTYVQTDIHRDRHIDIQTSRQTSTHSDRHQDQHPDIQKSRQINIQIDTHTDIKTHRYPDIQTDIWIDRDTSRYQDTDTHSDGQTTIKTDILQTYRWKDRHLDIQTDRYSYQERHIQASQYLRRQTSRIMETSCHPHFQT